MPPRKRPAEDVRYTGAAGEQSEAQSVTAPEVFCPACGGRGIISFGPDDVTCDACGGTGRS